MDVAAGSLAGCGGEGAGDLLEDVGARRVGGALPHRLVEAGHQLDGAVECGVGAVAVAAHQAQVARVLEAGDHGAAAS